MLPQAATDFYRGQQRLAVSLRLHARREWAAMGDDFDRSWLTVGPRLRVLSSAAQLGAARTAADYVPRLLSETRQRAEADGLVNPSAFSGVASDGRDLDGLLYGAVTTAKSAVGQGQSSDQALTTGGNWLDMLTQSMVADAGRMATSVAMAARPQVTGYIRMLGGSGCSRCAVLAGKWFRWNTGFLRHPRCHCVHVPAAENRAGDWRTDPVAAIREGKVTGLSEAQTKAILDHGADVSQVINASRGMDYARVFGQRMQITREGITVRGTAGKRLGSIHKAAGHRFRESAVFRLTPESIYQIGGGRANTIRLLKEHGYLL